MYKLILEVANSPWDQTQTCDKLAEGVYVVTTAGHGGLMVELTTARATLSPAAIRHGLKWQKFVCFEEDCDCAIAFFERPDWHEAYCSRQQRQLTDEARAQVLQSVKGWNWRYYEERTGEEIPPGESHLKDEYLFYQAHREDWVTVSATSGTSWEPVPAGFIKVTACKGGRNENGHYGPTREFLVPEIEYCGERDANGRRLQYPWKFAFIVDPVRHQEVSKQTTAA